MERELIKLSFNITFIQKLLYWAKYQRPSVCPAVKFYKLKILRFYKLKLQKGLHKNLNIPMERELIKLLFNITFIKKLLYWAKCQRPSVCPAVSKTKQKLMKLTNIFKMFILSLAGQKYMFAIYRFLGNCMDF